MTILFRLEYFRLLFYCTFLVGIPLVTSQYTTTPIEIKVFIAELVIPLYLGILVLLKAVKRQTFTINLNFVLFFLCLWLLWEFYGHLYPVIKEAVGDRVRLLILGISLIAITQLDFQFLKSNRMTIIGIGLLGASIVSVLAIYQDLFSGSLRIYENRTVLPSGTLGNHNLLASYLLFASGLLMVGLMLPPLVRTKSSFIKYYYLTIGVFQLIFLTAIWMSKSRSGLACYFVMVSLGLLWKFFSVWYYGKNSEIKMGFGKLLLSCGLAMIVVTGIFLYFFGDLARADKKQSLRVSLFERRIPIWKSALNMAKVHPVKGWGTGSFRVVFPAYKSKELKTIYFEPLEAWETTGDRTPIIAHAHNEFIEVLCEGGLVGISIFLIFLLSLYGKVLYLALRDKGLKSHWRIGLLIMLSGCLFQNIFTVTLRYPSTFLFYFFALGLLLSDLGGKQLKLRLDKKIYRAMAGVLVTVLVCFFVYNTSQRYYADILLQKSLVFLNSKRPTEASKCIEKAKLLQPSNPDIHYKEGYVAFALGDYPRAVAAYGRVIPLEPNFAQLHYNLGCAFYKLPALLSPIDRLFFD